jgi:hypothetical protein
MFSGRLDKQARGKLTADCLVVGERAIFPGVLESGQYRIAERDRLGA